MYIKYAVTQRVSIRIFLILSSVLLLSACAPKIEREFKKGCQSSGGSRSFCHCVYEQLENHYGEDTLKNVGQMKQLPPEDFQDHILHASQKCAYKMQ